MAEPGFLRNAPIAEALFDFRVSLPSDFDPNRFDALRERLKERYPIAERIVGFEAIFELKAGKPVASPGPGEALQGMRFKGDEGRNIAQFRRDGFTLNRLAKYTSYDELCPEALKLWQLFVEIAQPQKLDRVALRYINRLVLPGRGNLAEYLLVLPPTFKSAPPLVASLLMRQSRHDPTTGISANIVQSLESNVGAENSILTLDNDVYKSGGLSLNVADLEPVFAELRRIKNDIFFSTITDKAKKTYE